MLHLRENSLNKVPKNIQELNDFINNSELEYILRVKIVANSKKNSIEFLEEFIKIKVKKPAVDNLANEEIVVFLSDLLSLPKRNVKIISGQKASLKTLSFLKKT